MIIKMIGNKVLALLLALCMIFTICYGAIENISDTAFVYAVSEISPNAIVLKDSNYINKVTVSYIDGDNWVEVTEDNNSSLPVNVGYQLDVLYNNIIVNDLINSDYQMIYDQFPEWFVMSEPGNLMYGDVLAARIELIDGKVVINFDKDWVNTHGKDDVLSGSFKLFGTIDWRKLPEDQSEWKYPGADLEFDFESNQAQKYGKVDIEKLEPNLIAGDDGNYYLEYEIKVSSLDTVNIPDIIVRDLFSNVSYINGYVGIDSGLSGSPDLLPTVDGEAVDEISDVFFKDEDGALIWKLGDLGAEETHTLKYYAQISESYIDSVINNPIQNRAKVFSGAYQKDDDESSFTPQNVVELQKSANEPAIDPDGNGTITYTVVMSAPEDNSFDFTGLTFRDCFTEDLGYFLSGDNVNSITVKVGNEEHVVPYSDGSFELSGITLKKGETITITYTVSVKNIFLYNNGEVSLTNTASVSKSGRTLRSCSDTETLQKINAIRKIYGTETDEEQNILFGSDEVYGYDVNGDIVKDAERNDGFTVPKGSHKYSVILNESGNWDMSSTTMKDSFGGNEHIAYTGYVQIRLYGYSNENSAALSDDALVRKLEASVAVKTIWLKVDGLNDFSFTPQQLGVDQNKNYTYLLTYYATTMDMENVGKLDVTNDFELSGKIGYGDGSGEYFPFPGIHVSTGKVLKGSANYEAEKIGWYYESDVYMTEAVGDGYTENDFKETDYKNGAVYWIIRLEGAIPEGTATGSGNSTKLSGFVITDTPGLNARNDGPEKKGIVRDAVVGVYKGPKSADITQYASYKDFLSQEITGDTESSDNSDSRFTKLLGNPRNDKYFESYFKTLYGSEAKADYKWYASNIALEGIIFTSQQKLTDDEAIYIILRTVPVKPSSNTDASITYANTLGIKTDSSTFDVNTAQLTYQLKGSLFKESKGAYLFDKSTGTFTNCSNRNGGNDWNVSTMVGAVNLDSSGVYAAWLLNVNWDGSMSGDAYVNDYLPEGMELVYVDVNSFGNNIRTGTVAPPTTEYIQELSTDPAWQEMISECKVRVNNADRVVTTISYYNPETRQIRWHISGLTTADYKQREINLRIVCRVVDPELFFTCGSKNYVNHASIWDVDTQSDIEMETADVTIYWNIDKDINTLPPGAITNGNLITSTDNRLPFILRLNPLGLDMADGDILPPLIDKISEGFALSENTLKVMIGDGEEYTAFTYDVEVNNGCQTIIIGNLPDNTPITITYDVRFTSVPDPDNPPTITNTAYWLGYDPPDEAQVKDKQFKFIPNGDVFVDRKASVEITKVDADSHSKRLQGAVFDIYESDGEGNLGELIASGTTDSYGVFNYDNDEGKLQYGQIYCIKESSAPNGYKRDERCYYFVIMNNPDLNIEYSDDIDLDIWYDDPKYCCVIENYKGTIGVEKVFKDANDKEYIPTSASYNFGLFDGERNLLQTLTMEYTANGEVKYYLDGLPKNDPYFTKFEPTRRHYVYELDESGKPIMNGEVCEIGGIDFKVTYGSDGSSEVFVNSSIKITNKKTVSVSLPSTGGPGLKKYYVAGILTLIMFMAVVTVQYVKKRKRGGGHGGG